MKRVIVLLAICLLTSACATRLSPENSARLQTVDFNENVTLPPKAFYYGSEQVIGSLFGAIGSIVANSVQSEDERITQYLKDNNIDLGKMLITEFEKQLSEKPGWSAKLNQTSDRQTDANFLFTIDLYGLSIPNGFSSSYRPVLGVSGSLVDSNNEVLWEDSGSITALNSDVEGVAFEEYFTSPEIFRDKFSQRFEQVVSILMESL